MPLITAIIVLDFDEKSDIVKHKLESIQSAVESGFTLQSATATHPSVSSYAGDSLKGTIVYVYTKNASQESGMKSFISA